ncbi:MAG: hypothetical protein GC166_11860 [Alphaproteobacteria bacterium]|nr:hypothetical protein [Alphaproteobacteria bacterium]
MANIWARDRAGLFYAGFGFLCLAAVLAGFSTTYILPMASQSFSAPAIVHIHGALCLTWVLLFIVQTLLVRNRRTRLHMKAGYAGIPVALGIFVSGMGTAHWATARDIETVPTAFTTSIGTLTSLTIFSAFVVFAVSMRNRPDWHKRLMMLATVTVLWPAYFRFRHLMPWVPRPDIWLALVLADLPIVVAAMRDWRVYGKVHPVWAIFGTALIVEQSLELLLFETPLWNGLGRAIYRVLM